MQRQSGYCLPSGKTLPAAGSGAGTIAAAALPLVLSWEVVADRERGGPSTAGLMDDLGVAHAKFLPHHVATGRHGVRFAHLGRIRYLDDLRSFRSDGKGAIMISHRTK